MDQRNIILAIDDVEPGLVKALDKHGHRLGKKLEGIVLVDSHYPNTRERNRDETHTFKEVFCDYDNDEEVKAVLAAYRDRLLVVTCRQEGSLDSLRKVVPWLPEELDAPLADSLLWSTEKKLMRDKISAYDPSLTPRYYYLRSYSAAKVEHIISQISFPVIVKPNGLRASILVTHCRTAQELRDCLKQTFQIIQHIYERDTGHGEPSLLVEEMIQGEMYSTDVYVNREGKVYCLPLVKVITAHSIGLPGFYSYRHIIPTGLSNDETQGAYEAARKAVAALQLRSTTAHIELFKAKEGWKIIELGPRIGGYREDLYREAYGIDHYYNDLANRMNLPPEIPTKLLRHAAGINIYADREGTISSINGIDAARKLPGVVYVNPHAKPGDRALFAEHGGRLIVDGILSNADPHKLEHNVTRVRELVTIHVSDSPKLARV